MVKVGARIQMESEKVGVEPRGGVVTACTAPKCRCVGMTATRRRSFPTAGAMRVIEEGKPGRS